MKFVKLFEYDRRIFLFVNYIEIQGPCTYLKRHQMIRYDSRTHV